LSRSLTHLQYCLLEPSWNRPEYRRSSLVNAETGQVDLYEISDERTKRTKLFSRSRRAVVRKVQLELPLPVVGHSSTDTTG